MTPELDPTGLPVWSSFEHISDPINYLKVPQVFCHYSNWDGREGGDSIYSRFHKITGVNEWAENWTFYWGESPADTVPVGTMGARGDSASWNTENQKWVFNPDTGYWMLPDSGTFFLRIITDHYGCKDTLTIDSLIAILPPATEFTVTHEQLSSADPITTSTELVVCPQDYRLWVDGDPLTGSPLRFSPKESKYYIKYSGGVEDHSDTIMNVSYAWNFGDSEDTLRGNRWIDTLEHTYTNPGVYDVILAIETTYEFNAGSYIFSPPTPIGNQKVCRDTLKKSNFIKVSDITPSFTIEDYIICAWDTIKYTNTSIIEPSDDNGIFTLHWFFGFDTILNSEYSLINSDHFFPDGTMASFDTIINGNFYINEGLTTNAFNNPSHVYRNYGTFIPQLIVTDIWGCSDTVKLKDINGNLDTITIRRLPTPEFYAFNSDGDVIPRPSGCAPLEVNMTDISTYYEPADSLQWIWRFYLAENFNQGDTATWVLTGQFQGDDTAKVVLPKGTHHAFYKVTDTEGCSDSIWKYEYVIPTLPTPAFLTQNRGVEYLHCWNDEVIFTNTSFSNHFDQTNNGIKSSVWYYIENGVFVDSLQGIDPTSFVYDPNLTNGNNLTEVPVKLIVEDWNGCLDSITVNLTLSRPLPDFFADETFSVCPPFRADFHQNSSADVNFWFWTFERGTPVNNTGTDPQTFYDFPGDYDATLRVSNNFGCEDEITKPNYIVIGGPRANLQPPFTSGCSPLTVTLTASDTANIRLDKSNWVFGGGNNAPFIDTTETFTYIDPLDFNNIFNEGGILNIGLYLEDKDGCGVTYPAVVQVLGAYPDYNAPLFVCGNTTGTQINFTNNTRYWSNTDPHQSFVWIFGDGTTSSETNPVKTYNTPTDTKFTVGLVVNTQTCTDTIWKEIEIFMGSKFDFAYTSDPGCAPVNYYFAIDTTGNKHQIYNYTWNIPSNVNGAITGLNLDSIVTVPYPYTKDGQEELVSLTIRYGISSTEFCERTETRGVRIIAPEPVVASFDVDRDPIYATAAFNFVNNSTNDVRWDWAFGDGNSSNIENPSHSYLRSGEYPVMLISYSSKESCLDTAYLTVKVRADNFIPNVFTPNEDGRNDGFRIVGEFLDNFNMEIYNRWGKRVWETSSFFAAWDGTINGTPATEGTYFYKINGRDAVGDVQLTGTITLIRSEP
jgi:gliding motility-associated-like protein